MPSKPHDPQSPQKTPPAAPRAAAPSPPITVRLRPDLDAEVSRLALAAGVDRSTFFRAALEEHVSRVTLCRPMREVSLADLDKKLDLVIQMVGRMESRDRVSLELLRSIGLGMGVVVPDRFSE